MKGEQKMIINNLCATYQKSYYGKAKVINDQHGNYKLKSYETIVCEYDENTKTFKKFWNGYSRTTMNHINDFRSLFGLSRLSKKEWEKITCDNGNDEKYRVCFYNGFVEWKAEVIFDNELDAYEFAEKIIESRQFRIGAEIVRIA